MLLLLRIHKYHTGKVTVGRSFFNSLFTDFGNLSRLIIEAGEVLTGGANLM